MRGQPVVLLVALCAAFAPGCCLCPRVYRIGEAASSLPPPASFGVLFVPSGFTSRELPAFRVATDELARRVPVESPFGPDTAAGREEIRVEFFRIDLVGRHPRRNCESERGKYGLRSPAPSRPVPRGTPIDAARRRASSLPLDLRAEQVRCDELSIGLVGEAAALRLARCVPGVDVVVIVVNVDGIVGHTRQIAGTGDIGFVMIGIPLTASVNDRDCGTGNFVSPDAITSLQHELGHTLGLLDEYDCDPTDPLCDEKDWPSEAQFRAGRNVWKECRSAPLGCSGSQVQNGECNLTTVPWELGCSLTECCCRQVDGQVVVTPEHPEGQHPCADFSSECGLWEGAFYRDQGYFRSHENCRMVEVGMPFCPVCHELLTAALLSYSRTPPATGQETRP